VFHGFVFLTSLASIALFLTVYSLGVYLWQWRSAPAGSARHATT
jgi:hypothetical protein